MAPPRLWQDPGSLEVLQEIVSKTVPLWPAGLRPVQCDSIPVILDGGHLLCSTATGGGKSALFIVPILVHLEMHQNPNLYPNFRQRTRQFPVGIVVTPTKGLASNLVTELAKFGVPALAYSHETITDAKLAGRKLVSEIANCQKYRVIFVDPEHLASKDWRQISDSDIFRDNIIFACAEEAHLINEWGPSFRLMFQNIGAFFRGRLPSTCSIFALSATLQPGESTLSVCQSLGFVEGSFRLIRHSNERTNMQFIIKALENGVRGDEFPQLLPYLSSGRKTVIHCGSIDLVYRVYVYLLHCQPPGSDHLRRVRMYNSLCPTKYNEMTLYLLDHDPYCQIVVATVAFANGINIKSLLDSLGVGTAKTWDQIMQEKGRCDRDENTTCRGVVFAEPTVLAAAEKYLAAYGSTEPIPIVSPRRRKRSAVCAEPTVPMMDHAKARVLAEKFCHQSVINAIYQNSPIEVTTRSCADAGRRVPCGLCMDRLGVGASITFSAPVLPPGFLPLPAFIPIVRSPQVSNAAKDLKLKPKERSEVQAALQDFGTAVWLVERHNNPERTRSSFFPTPIITRILDVLLTISTPEHLDVILFSEQWKFTHNHAPRLYEVISSLQSDISGNRESARLARNAKARESARVRREATRTRSDIVNETSTSSPPPSTSTAAMSTTSATIPTDFATASNVPEKRVALDEITNQPPAKRPTPRLRQPAKSVVQTMSEYGPQYRPSTRRARG